MPDFLFVTCQIGFERAVKREVAGGWPAFRFAFSQPGFLTFKLPPDHGLADDSNPVWSSAGPAGSRWAEWAKRRRRSAWRVWELCEGPRVSGYPRVGARSEQAGRARLRAFPYDGGPQCSPMLIDACPHAKKPVAGGQRPTGPAGQASSFSIA